jgi:hypothetical protein
MKLRNWTPAPGLRVRPNQTLRQSARPQCLRGSHRQRMFETK